jgi:hypothetical protein
VDKWKESVDKCGQVTLFLHGAGLMWIRPVLTLHLSTSYTPDLELFYALRRIGLKKRLTDNPRIHSAY